MNRIGQLGFRRRVERQLVDEYKESPFLKNLMALGSHLVARNVVNPIPALYKVNLRDQKGSRTLSTKLKIPAMLYVSSYYC
jgi:hypothetical protein